VSRAWSSRLFSDLHAQTNSTLEAGMLVLLPSRLLFGSMKAKPVGIGIIVVDQNKEVKSIYNLEDERDIEKQHQCLWW
jgi:hypothetical protein